MSEKHAGPKPTLRVINAYRDATDGRWRVHARVENDTTTSYKLAFAGDESSLPQILPVHLEVEEHQDSKWVNVAGPHEGIGVAYELPPGQHVEFDAPLPAYSYRTGERLRLKYSGLISDEFSLVRGNAATPADEVIGPGFAEAEVADPVPIEELALSSPIVVRAYVRARGELTTSQLGYRLLAVDIVEVLKGEVTETVGRVGEPGVQAAMVVSQHRGEGVRHLAERGRYEPGLDYYFFVQEAGGALLVETRLSNENPAHRCEPALTARIVKAIKEDALKPVTDWRIPPDAVAREIAFEPDQVEAPVGDVRISRIVEYTIADEVVGERRWWSNGRLQSQTPMRYGVLHGLMQAWAPDGRLVSESSWRFGRLHGPARGDAGKPEYFVSNEPVSREAYLEAAAKDATLPKVD